MPLVVSTRSGGGDIVELIPSDGKCHRVTAAVNIKYKSPGFPCYTLTFQYLFSVVFFIVYPSHDPVVRNK